VGPSRGPVPVSARGLAYEFDGDGTEPVVLVHGSWTDRRCWRALTPVLSSSLRTLVYDRRGLGESAVLPGMRSVAWEADELGDLLVETDHFPAHVVGVSYGAAVALSLAVRRPELVRSVSAHEAPLLAWPPVENETEVRAARKELDLYANRFRKMSPDAAAREFAERFVTGPDGFERLPFESREGFVAAAPAWPEELGALERADLDAGLLGTVDLPVLLTEGSVSPAYLRRITTSIAGSLPNTTRLTLEGAGHFPHLSHPALFGGTLLSFLLERDVPVS
jgi:pimeloyl-ACP methyl ester carboxylesterase